MRRSLLGLLVLLGGGIAGAQVHHSCPHLNSGLHAYENPLYKKWLSSYDVKSYHLYLEANIQFTTTGHYP